MQSDEMIWQVVNHQFCSYKARIGRAKSDTNINFCKHPYSITGLCNRTSCPLANSKYATIREENGKIHLYIKTVERAHTPKNLWEKIQLSRNYGKALTQLDEHLQYFPKVIIHRNKQRLTKIYQYLIRIRKIELKKRAGLKAKMVRIHRKIEQRDERREQKALLAAKLEKNIEKELITRLSKGTYGDIYNFPQTSYINALEKVEEKQEIEETDESEESEDEMDGLVEYVEDLEDDDEVSDEEEEIENMDYLGNNEWGTFNDDDDDDDDGNDSENNDNDESSEESSSSSSESDSDDNDEKKKKQDTKKSSRKPRRIGPRIEIEYEEEHEANNNEAIIAAATTNDW